MKEAFGLAILAAITVGCFFGCAGKTKQPPLAEIKLVSPDRMLAFKKSSKKETAKIIVMKDIGVEGTHCYDAFYIDGKLAAKLDVSEVAIFYVKPGLHNVKLSRDPKVSTTCWESKDSVEASVISNVTLKADERKCFRLSMLEGKYRLGPCLKEH